MVKKGIDLIRGGVNLGFIRNVAFKTGVSTSIWLEVFGNLPTLFHVSTQDDHIRPALSKCRTDAKPNTSIPPCDHDIFSLYTECVCHIHDWRCDMHDSSFGFSFYMIASSYSL
jgi:hypothetical protein